MPVNKRNKVVSLTKVNKKGQANKDKLIEDVRTACDTFKHVFVFSVPNMRNSKFKDMRQQWLGSKFFLGKNKVMAHALGMELSSEHKAGTSKIARHLKGQCGLLFTDTDVQEVLDFFNEYEETNFARSGFKCTHDFALEKGILEDQPFSIEPQLRRLGLNTRLNNGKVELEADTQVCRAGDKLTPSQCKLLELFGVEMAVMRVLLHAHLDLNAGKFQLFEIDEVEEGDAAEEEDEE